METWDQGCPKRGAGSLKVWVALGPDSCKNHSPAWGRVGSQRATMGPCPQGWAVLCGLEKPDRPERGPTAREKQKQSRGLRAPRPILFHVQDVSSLHQTLEKHILPEYSISAFFFFKPFTYVDFFLYNIPNKQIFCLCLHISGDRELIARPVGLLSDFQWKIGLLPTASETSCYGPMESYSGAYLEPWRC